MYCTHHPRVVTTSILLLLVSRVVGAILVMRVFFLAIQHSPGPPQGQVQFQLLSSLYRRSYRRNSKPCRARWSRTRTSKSQTPGEP
ncbi:hypothetical protein F4819DRAFT_480797 [Hypoxylon fuscum]|nr:hypothetical protein F4819DRAFT_480797 [Hypoxylon fuscum]